MIAQFFSAQARKAWVAGVLSALLAPLNQLLAVGGELSLSTLGAALASGLASAAVVFLTSNAPAAQAYLTDEPGDHAADR